ncbi:MAG: T9SS type A sorting domain-containing protein [Bacteroidota bacterium]
MLRLSMLVLLSMCLHSISAQSLSRQVISSLGNDHPQLSYTVGETVVQTAISGSFILTQGFHQPDQNAVGIDKDLAAIVDFRLFPNPARDQLNLELSSPRPLDLRINITDLRGRQVHPPQRMLVQGTSLQSLDISSLAEGLYLLRLSSQQGATLHTIKFKRLD